DPIAASAALPEGGRASLHPPSRGAGSRRAARGAARAMVDALSRTRGQRTSKGHALRQARSVSLASRGAQGLAVRAGIANPVSGVFQAGRKGVVGAVAIEGKSLWRASLAGRFRPCYSESFHVRVRIPLPAYTRPRHI